MATPPPDQQPTHDQPERQQPAPELDPVRQRREVFRTWVSRANRLGYLLLLAAIVVFVVAFVTDFTSTMATIVIVLFVASCVLLAPSIVLGYAVKAADREDRERGL